MMIREKFDELRGKKEGALIAYICAGDPIAEKTVEIVDALVKGGVDMIELGLPFSDPVADGATIQAAIDRALTSGMNPDKFFKLAGSMNVNVPLIVMTYYNLIFRRGIKRFVSDCKSAGISGIIVPDLPVEESEELHQFCRDAGVDLIFIVAPTTTEERMNLILDKASGFLYIVSRLGVTGVREDVADSTEGLLKRIKAPIPKAVGFGISKPEHVREILKAGADGVIVGSAFVNIIAKNEPEMLKSLENLATTLKSVTLNR
ncbi:MAG: tryptophan synthase subunit alpha [Methanosarcinales archaeon]|nr:MAG: tryptophan synthase subunit alpha [Methanosarcinales archaeon]